jgi:hypothetical protein
VERLVRSFSTDVTNHVTEASSARDGSRFDNRFEFAVTIATKGTQCLPTYIVLLSLSWQER